MANKDGFFISLGLDLDKGSFDTSKAALGYISSGISNIIGAAKNAAITLGVMAVASGKVASQEIKTATAMGASIDKLNTWKAAAKIAGVSADGLVSSIGDLADVMNHIGIDGKGLDEYSKNLGLLSPNLNMTDLEGMDPTDAYQKILEEAQKKYAEATTDKGRLEIVTKVGDLLGDAGQGLFIELNRTKTSVQEFLEGVNKAIIHYDPDKVNGAADFNREWNTMEATMQSLGKALGLEAANAMKEPMAELNNFLQQNLPLLESAIKSLGTAAGNLAAAAAKGIAQLGVNVAQDVEQFKKGKKLIEEGKVAEGLATALWGGDYAQDEAEIRLQELSKDPDAQLSAIDRFNIGARNVPGLRTIYDALDTYRVKWGLLSGDEYRMMYGDKGIGSSYIKTSAEIAAEQKEQLRAQAEKDLGVIPSTQGMTPESAAKSYEEMKKEEEKAMKFLKDTFPKNAAKLGDLNKYPQLKEYYEAAVRASLKPNNNFDFKKYYSPAVIKAIAPTAKVNDGIISPDGRVTQVAPDDWVIAARDLGNVARAFFPHPAASAGPASFVINQNFTISGSSDMPHVLRQQAYRGTQEGLQQVIAQNAQRLQMMSGTL